MWKRLPRWARAAFWTGVAVLLLSLIAIEVVAFPAETGGGAPLAPAADPLIVIHMAGMRFTPAYASVSPGTSVIFRNDDGTFHQVVADDGTWNSPVLAPGEEFSRTFPVPDSVTYHCALYPEMQGTLMVGNRLAMPLIARDALGYLTSTPTPTATSTPGATSAVIGPDGGSLAASDQSAQVDVPQGAVDRKVRFSYAPATPDLPPDLADGGNAFDLTAIDLLGTPVVNFAKPVSLTLRIADAPSSDTGGLGLFFQGAGSDLWEEVESVIDLEQGVVTGAADHLSLFALLRRPLPLIFWKAGGWRDYAPSGIPDFDQRQDGWRNASGQWTFCGPVAAANSLWWFDSKFEPQPQAPPTLNDHYPLVSSYAPGVWDDHDPRNVQPFVGNLAGLMGTGGNGTRPNSLVAGIKTYLAVKGLDADYTVTLQKRPSFPWVTDEVVRSEDVILLIGFWQNTYAGWRRIGGHYVTVPGVDINRGLIAFSDPIANAAEAGGWGRVLPPVHPVGHAPALHNDARFVSHDLYRVIVTNSPGGTWGPWGYTRWLPVVNFRGQNVPDEFTSYQGYYMPNVPVVGEVEYAIAVSPVLVSTPTPTVSVTPRPTFTPTPSATPTPTATMKPSATPTPTATPEFFWKAGGWKDYAPSGVPDFDQKQDTWGLGGLGTPNWQWTYCGPVSVANSLWWFDSKFEPAPVPPPAINDGYNLVTAYAAAWDDHDPRNVDNPATLPGSGGELVEDLAWRMDTDGQRTATAHRGTEVHTLYNAIRKYLNDRGLSGAYSVTLMKQPSFDWVAKEVRRSEDVILLLGFWEQRLTGAWERVAGHYVTAAGVGAVAGAVQQGIAFSDPYRDNAEVGGAGRVLPAPHMLPHPATMHNDAAYASHDIWPVAVTNSPGGTWGPVGYASTALIQNFALQNVPDEFASLSGSYTGGPIQVEVEYAVAVSPVEQTPTPTATPTVQPPSIVVLKLDHAYHSLPGWTMTLFNGSDCSGIPVGESATDTRGLVDFTGLLPAVYSVLERLQPGYENVSPLCQPVDLSQSQSASAALAPLIYPPAGQDTFPSGAYITLDLNDVGPVSATLNGPTTVRRGDPSDADGDGLMEIQTEIVSMNLTGTTTYGPVGLIQSPTEHSYGRVEQQAVGADYPADSFFDVFVEIQTPLGPLHNLMPVRMQATINAIPPILAFYQSASPVPLYNAAGSQAGVLRHALHIPLPPREKLITFVNRPAPTMTPTATRKATYTPTATATPTRTMTPTRTPTPTATRKPLLTGVESTFSEPTPGQIEIRVHVNTDNLSGKIFDLEIFYNEQHPAWGSAQPAGWPTGWTPMAVPGGVGFVTSGSPLRFCQWVTFTVQVSGVQVGNTISIHLTDANHGNLGYINSQRVQ